MSLTITSKTFYCAHHIIEIFLRNAFEFRKNFYIRVIHIFAMYERIYFPNAYEYHAIHTYNLVHLNYGEKKLKVP